LPYFRLSATFANSINFVLVALTAELEATKKAFSEEKTALAEEKATQLIVDRSFAEENATRQLADQYLWASEEAKAALPQDLISVQASLTATMGKLASMSSALDFVVDQECLVEIKLQTAKEKSKA
jgi:ribonucleotide reductase alpha subunit